MMVIIGLPNAGKTTISKSYPNALSYDDIRHLPKEDRYEIYKQIAETDGVVEGVFNTIKSRNILLKYAKAYNHKNICIWVDTPLETCIEREKNYRRRPLAIVYSHARSFEPPTLDEGWDEIIIIRPDTDQPVASAES